MGQLPERKKEEDREIVREWGVKLAEEIESYTHSGVSSIKTGHLEDALEEAQVVLEIAGERDLARRALELSARAAEARLVMRSTRAITTAVERVRVDAQKFAVEMKKRLSRKVRVDAATR